MSRKLNLEKYMRFLRLYLNGIFNRLDKDLNPTVNIITIKKHDGLVELEILPEYHELNGGFENQKSRIDNYVAERNFSELCDMIFKEYDRSNKIKSFTSSVAEEVDFMFLVRIGLNRPVFKSHEALKRKTYGSLVQASIKQVVNEISQRNRLVLDNMDFELFNYKETLRRSANNFIASCIDQSIVLNIFDQINNISSLYYENNASTGRIVFLDSKGIKEGHRNIDEILLLAQKVSLYNTRLIRKLLEMCKSGIALLSDGKYVYGICRIVGKFNERAENIFVIDFLDLYEWNFVYNKKTLIKSNHNEIFLPQNEISYLEFKLRVKELFPEIDLLNLNRLFLIMNKAIEQKNGTMLVISKNAKSEINRLKSQGFLVQPKIITPDIVKKITSIDGAVLIDTDCVCYGIGVILDGMATTNGDTSRGARYNSAIRYVETIKNNKDYSDCLAVVISEDGYVDLVSKHTLSFLMK
ncbi:MAG TPA: DNA integrity scanning protein DisA nucleotide-binding domain protein [Clostridia bacterium]|nr:DNA integrity scanning protein DisA nucleotide-binding domain protein [Clostridia bacterium]